MHTNHRRPGDRPRRTHGFRPHWYKSDIKHAEFKGWRKAHRRLLDQIRLGSLDAEDALFPKRARDVSNTLNHRYFD